MENDKSQEHLGIEYKPLTEGGETSNMISQVKLDQLGPVVINEDGTISRITNWANLSKQEQENTQRIIGKRNAKRLIELEKLEAEKAQQ